MKLVTYVNDGPPRLGALVPTGSGERVHDLHALDARLPADVLDFLAGGRPVHDLAVEALAAAPPDAGLDPGAITLLAPVPKPGKIICIGQNYLAHAQEANASAAPYPIIFAKFNNTVIGHGQPIVVPASVHKPDYEGDLAVVIGRRGRYIPEGGALA